MKRIAVLDDYQNIALRLANWSAIDNCFKQRNDGESASRHAAPSVSVENFTFPTGNMKEGQLVELLQPFEVVCVMRERTPLSAALLNKLPRLKLIVTSGMRNTSIHLNTAKENGVAVCGTPSPAHSTAELAMLFILALARNLTGHHAAVQAGGWQLSLGRTLHGARLGLLGLGRLGRKVAGMAKAFGMQVGAYSQNLTADVCKQQGVSYLQKNELFETSDFVSIHLKASERTKNMVGKAELALMQPTACLINTSRASIVDYNALSSALRTGRLAGAAVDVFEKEPLAFNDPIRKTPNLLFTPHIGYVCEENYKIYYTTMVENIIAFYKKAPINAIL